MGKDLAIWNEPARDEMFALLEATQPPTQDLSAQILFEAGDFGSGTGVLWGGNLTVLASLCGTTQMLLWAVRTLSCFSKTMNLNNPSHCAAQQ